MDAFRKRAATLLSVGRSQVDLAVGNHSSSQSPTREKLPLQETSDSELSRPGSGGAGSHTQSAVAIGIEELNSGFSHTPVRVLPPWVDDAHEDNEDEDDPNPSSQLLPEEPSVAHAAHHNHTPAVFQPPAFLTRTRNEPGRRHDARRGSEPPLLKHHPREAASRWKQFVQDTEYPRNHEEHRQLVDEEYLIEHGPDFSGSSNDGLHHSNINAYRSRKRTAWERAQRTVLRSAFIPLIFRLVVFSFCLMALGLGGTIYRTTGEFSSSVAMSDCSMDYETTTTSPLMAVVIDAAAIIYLFYITWDEYKGLPLGLRSVFSSANVTLAFESILRFDISCQVQEGLQKMKWKQEYLASTLLVALVAWLLTFAVSILRVVERVEQT